MHTYRILLLNLGYETGLDGSLRGYLTRSWRYLHTPRAVIDAVHSGFRELIENVRPMSAACLRSTTIQP